VNVTDRPSGSTRLRGQWSRLAALFRRQDAPDTPRSVRGILRGPRLAALLAIAALVATASGAAFAESYRGLYEWAGHHGLGGFWQAAFPLQVDVFIAVGELALFVALTDGWRKRDRLGAWLVTLAGLAVSVAGNVGHVASHRLTDRGTAAVPPLAAAAALAVGLGVLKRVVAARSREPEPGQAKRRSVTVPDGKIAAARMALAATKEVGNPWPERQLVARFDISRGEADSLYREFGLKPSMNGGGGHA
jgi:hypothetical protein